MTVGDLVVGLLEIPQVAKQAAKLIVTLRQKESPDGASTVQCDVK